VGRVPRLHHAKSDTPEDISSPGVGGFWWSQLRWLWQAGTAPVQRYCRDMDRPTFHFWGRCRSRWRCGVPVRRPFGLAAFLWLGPIRLTWALHQQGFVNSICHMRKVSSRGGDGEERRLALAVPCLPGRELAPEPPRRPGSARLGWKPFQLDTGWYTILLLEKLGLATDVRRPDLGRSMDAAA